ncbi:dipeptidase [Amedibacillus sp. YH-ame6]
MIKFFNLHDDIGSDIFEHRIEQPNRLDDYHYPKMKQGGIDTTAIVCCFSSSETWQDMMEQVLYVNASIERSGHYSFGYDKDIRVFIALEGMCGIRDQVRKKIQWLYQHNVRMASLCWNDHNALACGAKSGNMPLSDLGIECIEAMNEVHMAIDVSHCCEWNFYDIQRISTTPILATHSNVKGLFHHYRNLSDPQIQVIQEHGGILGALPVRWFVTRDESKQTLKEFIKIIDYIKERFGTQLIALGFDFMDYMDDPTCMVKGLDSVAHIQNLANQLLEHGYSQEEVETICFGNANRYMESYLIYENEEGK